MYTETSTSGYRNSNKFNKQKEKFQAYTTQSKTFGMGTVVWKSGDTRKLKTIYNY